MRISVAITVFAIVALAPATGLAQSTSASFSVAIDTPDTTLKIGSEIRVNIVLTNTTDHNVQIFRERGGNGEFDYTLDVSDSAGHIPAETEYYLAVQNKQGPSRPMLVIMLSGGPHLMKPQ